MTEKVPPDEGNAQPAASSAGAATADEVGVGADNASGRPPEVDVDDDDWSPVPGRSRDEDVRIAIHEAGHAVAARALGPQVGGVTVNPSADGSADGPMSGGRVQGSVRARSRRRLRRSRSTGALDARTG